MPVILCIETATTVCSVALFSENGLLGYQEYHIEKSHSNLLPSIVDGTLAAVALSRSDISAVAVSEGPGSYTGLRIGASIAKGLCYAFDIPLIAVNTLHVMAQSVQRFNHTNALLCPMIDARRMEVYATVLNPQGQVLLETSPVVVDEGSFSNYLTEGPVLFFGNGSDKCRGLIGHHHNAVFLPDVVPMAKAMGDIAMSMFRAETFVDVAYFEPFYLKEFQGTKPKALS